MWCLTRICDVGISGNGVYPIIPTQTMKHGDKTYFQTTHFLFNGMYIVEYDGILYIYIYMYIICVYIYIIQEIYRYMVSGSVLEWAIHCAPPSSFGGTSSLDAAMCTNRQKWREMLSSLQCIQDWPC